MFLHVDGVILNTEFIITCTPTNTGGTVKINDGTNNGFTLILTTVNYNRLTTALQEETLAIQRSRDEVGIRK